MRFTAIAAITFSGMPVLWPSPWPGAPSMIGSGNATPGFCDACGMPSMSDPSAITGLPEPHLATHAVGMPATPRCTVKPNFSSCAVRYRDVSNSWKPSSPKLKTESTISCASLDISSTPLTASFL
jgi:hypothetical protein